MPLTKITSNFTFSDLRISNVSRIQPRNETVTRHSYADVEKEISLKRLKKIERLLRRICRYHLMLLESIGERHRFILALTQEQESIAKQLNVDSAKELQKFINEKRSAIERASPDQDSTNKIIELNPKDSKIQLNENDPKTYALLTRFRMLRLMELLLNIESNSLALAWMSIAWKAPFAWLTLNHLRVPHNHLP